MFSKQSAECGLGMRKYLYWVGVLATITLVGSYWYLNYYLDEIGIEAHEILSTPQKVDPQVGVPTTLTGMSAAPVAWPAGSPAIPFAGTTGMSASVVVKPVVGGTPFAEVVRTILPTVVNVSSQERTIVPTPGTPSTAQPPTGVLQFASPYSGVGSETLGSGVIVTTDGYVVSNYHVVENSKNVFVTVFGPLGNQRYPAEIVQQDAIRDLVLLKIRVLQPLPVATLGNSDSLQLGEPVITVGCPFGLDQTVSKGVVSGLRESVVIGGIVHGNLVQTDAAINQGNSGGPVVSAHGEVVAINTAIYSPTQAFSGVGFAVPANSVRDFLNEAIQLPTTGRGVTSTIAPQNVAVRRIPPPIPANSIAPHGNRGACESCHQIITSGQLVAQSAQSGTDGSILGIATGRTIAINTLSDNALGATFKSVDAYLIQRFRPPIDGGVFVTRVAPGSTSEQAGLAGGDLIFKANGRWMRTPEELQTLLASLPAGERVRLGVMRNQERREIAVTLAALPTTAVAQQVAAPIYPCQGMGGMQPVGRGFGPGFRYRQPTCVPGTALAQPVAAQTPVAIPTPDAINTAPGQATPVKPPKTPANTEFEWQGMELVPITTAMIMKDASLKSKLGAVVKELDPGLTADLAGIKANDIVLAINGSPITSSTDLDKAIAATAQANTILLDVDRGGQRLPISLK